MTTFRPANNPLHCAVCGKPRIMHMPEDLGCVGQVITNDIWPTVIREMHERDQLGRERYGRPLTPHNGRDALRDAYEEAQDLCAYLRQAMFERDGK